MTDTLESLKQWKKESEDILIRHGIALAELSLYKRFAEKYVAWATSEDKAFGELFEEMVEAYDVIEQADEARRKMFNAIGWIDVRDRLPEDSYALVDVILKHDMVDRAVNYSDGTFYIDYDMLDITEYVTNWKYHTPNKEAEDE